ncbi:transcriptional regulator, GntR family/aminotransferase, classes I and II [Acidobacterium capsulatum ATCC 51196]|uniref:Transcriptional regulator, GntR family/aminotransferase, classes I and II n=2 Tax=Acidobacteriaceae TaxID=204434 RepID=C1F7F6_ACIC5|nr:transcriptional regulator, GntR family/aminotransferase, classes I and II [Acidobacterium capsulatum ATCC 51196]
MSLASHPASDNNTPESSKLILKAAMKTLSGIWLDRDSNITLQDQVVQQVKALIRRGALHPQEMLPSSRELATQLRISRNTVVYAYDRLVSEGYVEARFRSGVFVSEVVPQQRRVRDSQAARHRKVLEREVAAPSGSLRAPLPFRPCQPDVSLFPLPMWNRLRGRALREHGKSLLHYQESCVSGLPALRQNIAQYLQASRGVQCDWRQIVITSGSQQALCLLARLLVPAFGSRVYMEDPGYLGARLAWQSVDARIVPGALDENGLQLPTSELRDLALIYTTPSRQFPTGVSLSLPRRLAILDYARRHKTWVIEDDYDAEFRYKAAPLPSLQSLDEDNRVIYVGTFSKALFPALRLGYVVVPAELFDRFRAAKHLMDDHGPLVDQATLAMFLESGAFHSHIRRCRKAYAERQECFLELFSQSDLPLEFRYTDGGMNLLGWLPEGSDDRRLSKRLREDGLDIPALTSYSLKARAPGLVFGFTAFDPATIRRGFARVREHFVL